MRQSLLLIALSLCLCGSAFGKIYQRISRPALISIMKKNGLQGMPSEKNKNHVVFMVEGYKGLLIINDKGDSIQFYIGFDDAEKTNLVRVNEWNKTRKYSRSYLDEEGDPILMLDLDLVGGVTGERIVDYLQTCRLSLPLWKREVVD